ncbi:hypothetical protein [Methanococcoides sp.]|uniref:hypothetical protein n=1 Tax=Methanococcoides sp. TaxID=1966350 RepID=UPI00272E66A9|nr:hypothetical protein [Methanococcoides sp.]
MLDQDYSNILSKALSIDNWRNLKDIKLEEIQNFLNNPYVMYHMSSSGYYLLKIPTEILNSPTTRHYLDSYYSLFFYYDLEKNPDKDGLRFSPVFHFITELTMKYEDEKQTFDFLYRKTAFLLTLNEELNFISERYKWGDETKFREVFLSKFENLCTSLVELFISLINIYEKLKLNHDKLEVEKFTDIFKFFNNPENKLPTYYHDANSFTVNFSLYIFIRNSLVHNFKEVKYEEDIQNLMLKIDNIPHNRREGFNKYIEYSFKRYTGRKTSSSFQEHVDDQSPHIKIHFWLNRKSKLEVEKTKIEFNMDIIKLSKEMLNYLYIFEMDLFREILSER